MAGEHVAPALPYALSGAMRAPVETSIVSLLERCGWSADVDLLGSMSQLQATMDAYGLELHPSLGEGGLDTIRVLRLRVQPDALNLALDEIAGGENAIVEFKSTLFLDRNEWEKDNSRPIREYRSDKIIKSSVKTVAAYLNTNGGTLLIGISDDGEWYGLKDDFRLADDKKVDFDGWELELRKQIDRAFLDQSVNSYITVSRIQKGAEIAARVQVARRSSLTFLRSKDASDELYIRSGNRSIPVSMRELDNYFDMKRLYA